MADLIVVMRDGAVEQTGTPLEIFDRPANVFVAGFIGSPAMNLMEGTVFREQDRAWVESRAGRVPLPPGVVVSSGARVVYGVRPAALVLSDDADAIKARIETVEPTGESTQIHVLAGAERLVVAFPGRLALKRGAEILLRPIESMVHVFDAASGKRLEGTRP